MMTRRARWIYSLILAALALRFSPVTVFSRLSVRGSVPVGSYSNLYDALNRRTRATLEDGSRWRYAYDDRDELITGKRTWADWTPE